MFFQATLAQSFIRSLRTSGDDDFVDRLNYYYTPIMLGIACIIISAKQYGGTPIECWVNPHTRESMEEYIESYCWIQNTYWVPMFENIPDDHTARESRQISYYQWVPFILIAEALMFSFPCIVWRLLSWQSGINLQNLISTACDAQNLVDQQDKDKAIKSVAKNLIDILDLQSYSSNYHNVLTNKFSVGIGERIFAVICFWRRFRGSVISLLYLVIKLCYTGNIVLQFGVLNAALKSDSYALYGFQVLSDLLHGRPWTESGHFPRVTLCDFEVRYLANLNRYTVQCALLINFINEKVFAFFWCWYLILVVLTTFSCAFWLANSCLNSSKISFVMKFIQIASQSDEQQEKKFDSKPIGTGGSEVFRASSQIYMKFVEKFLDSDGVFTLRLMANHAGDVVVMQIVRELWMEFRERNWQDFQFETNAKLSNSQASFKQAYVELIANNPLNNNDGDDDGGVKLPYGNHFPSSGPGGRPTAILRHTVSEKGEQMFEGVQPSRLAHSHPPPLADANTPLL